MQRDQITALILAGGKATRMGGVDKRELVIAGRTTFERHVEALAPCVAEIIVSSPRPIAGVRWIEEGELRAVDPQLRALHNVNAPEDMSP